MLGRMLLACVLIAVTLNPRLTSRAEHDRADLTTAIDSMVRARARADSFSGVVLFSRPGAPVYQRALGIANRETGARMATNTKLQIASMTKLFTQIAIRQLEQAGKLSLSDTVGTFLPAYHNATVRSRVTVEQLLAHRSGVGSYWNQRFMSNLAHIRTVENYIELFQDDSLLFAPGTGEVYSNGGYVLLGAIIERVSGESYHDYLRAHVFGPAGMTETMPYDVRSPRSNAAVGYTFMDLAGAPTGDTRLAGTGRRPGNGAPAGEPRNGLSMTAARPDSASGGQPEAAPSGARFRIIGADGKEMNPDDARAAIARRAANGATRHSNVGREPSKSGPAGDHYSAVGDLLKLARALTTNKLLDSERSASVLGQRYAAGGDFRANGGAPGTNAEFSIFPSGEVIVVLSNYDPPAATEIAEFIRSRLTPASAWP